jgi:hypothetical protein
MGCAIPRVGIYGVIVVIGLLVSWPSRAEQPGHPTPNVPPDHRHHLIYTSMTALQLNALGFGSDLDIGYRYDLYPHEESQSPLFKGSHLDFLGVAKLTPAYGRIGVAMVVQPLAVLRIRAEYLFRGYFTSFDMLQSFATADADYRGKTLASRADNGQNYGTTGTEAKLEANLQMKIGPIAIWNQFALLHFKMRLQDGDHVFYDTYLDMLLPNGRPVITNNAHLIYVTNFGLRVGVRHALVHAFYPKEWLGVGGENNNTPTHRLGPFAAYTLPFGKGRRFNKPTLILILNWWLQNRYRTGQDINQGIPYTALAFRFSGDLMSW